MADNVQVSDNPVVAADVIGGVAYQRAKVVWGVDGTSVDTSESNPLPVSLVEPVGISDGTNDLILLDLTSSKPVPSAIVDRDGAQVGFPAIQEFTANPTIGTGGNVQYDSLHTTIITFTDVVPENGGVGQILAANLSTTNDSFRGQVRAYFFDTSFTGTTAQDPLSISDTDVRNCFGSLLFDLGNSYGTASQVVHANRADLPLLFKCDNAVNDIFCVLQLWSDDTPTFSSASFALRIYVLAED